MADEEQKKKKKRRCRRKAKKVSTVKRMSKKLREGNIDISEMYCDSSARSEAVWKLEIVALSKYPKDLLVADNRKKIMDALVKRFRGSFSRIDAVLAREEKKHVKRFGSADGACVCIQAVGLGQMQNLFVTFSTGSVSICRCGSGKAFRVSHFIGYDVPNPDFRSCERYDEFILTEQAWNWHRLVNAKVPKCEGEETSEQQDLHTR